MILLFSIVSSVVSERKIVGQAEREREREWQRRVERMAKVDRKTGKCG